MTPLAFPFTKNRFRHDLVERQGDVCLVARTNLAIRPPTKPTVHWEVVILQHHPAKTMLSGKHYPAREAYPPTEDWGTHGWTYADQAEARTRMAKLCAASAHTATQGGDEG